MNTGLSALNRERLQSIVLLGAVSFSLLCIPATSRGQNAADEQLLSTVVAGYTRNKERLGNFRCEFRIVSGITSSFEAARKKDIRRISAVDCVWIRDGDREKFRMAGDEKWMAQALADAAKSPDGKYPSPFVNFTEIRQGLNSLRHDEIAFKALFYSRQSEKSRVGHSLFSYGLLSFGEEKGFVALSKALREVEWVRNP
jgi:hypothetical protein